MNQIKYLDFVSDDFEALFRMSQELWTDFEENELKKHLVEAVKLEKNKVLMAKIAGDKSVGFSYFSIRSDYVEGAESSPTGYLEESMWNLSIGGTE